jgi:membrane fusion protein (multidrug efflux system)
MAVDIAVDQADIPRYAAMLANPSPEKDSTFSVLLPDGSVYPYPGRLFFIDRSVDPQTGTIKVRFLFPNPKNILKPGVTTSIRVKNNSAANSLMVPYKAIVEQLGENFVFVIQGERAFQRKVSLGNRIRDKVIVRSGLQQGDVVATDGVQKLRDSSSVRLTAAKPASGK